MRNFTPLQIFSKSTFFFNDTATTEIYTLSLHDALPIFIFKNKLVKKISLKLEKLDILKKTKSVGIAVSKTKI